MLDAHFKDFYVVSENWNFPYMGFQPSVKDGQRHKSSIARPGGQKRKRT